MEPEGASVGEGASGHGPILFYDGDCGLCSRAVAWCLERDRRGRLRFAPLQGATFQALRNETLRGAALEPPEWTHAVDTLVLHEGGRFLVRGDGVIATLAALGGPWSVLARVLGVAPRGWRDALYRAIARRRHRLGAVGAHCGTPSLEQRARMLP